MAERVPIDKTCELIERIDEATNFRTIEGILHQIGAPFGLTSVFGGILPRGYIQQKDVNERILLQRFPGGWAERYNLRGYLFRDPIVERLQTAREPFYWKEAYDTSAFRKNVELIAGEAEDFGLCGGFVVPITLLDGSIAAVSYGGGEPKLSADQQSLLGFAASYAVGALIQRRRGAERARGRISAREYDCLLWAAEGKTDWEISIILGVSKPTVTKHILSAREKLHAVTKTHAIAVALREKIIR